MYLHAQPAHIVDEVRPVELGSAAQFRAWPLSNPSSKVPLLQFGPRLAAKANPNGPRCWSYQPCATSFARTGTSALPLGDRQLEDADEQEKDKPQNDDDYENEPPRLMPGWRVIVSPTPLPEVGVIGSGGTGPTEVGIDQPMVGV